MTNETILSFLAENPGSIAAEIGASSVEMTRLFNTGEIIKVGERKTGQRGRPPVEWALPGFNGIEAQTSEAVEKAVAKIADYRAYRASADGLWHVREEYGAKAPEAIEASERHYERYPRGGAAIPPVPTANDYALAGLATEQDTEDDA